MKKMIGKRTITYPQDVKSSVEDSPEQSRECYLTKKHCNCGRANAATDRKSPKNGKIKYNRNFAHR